MISFSDFYSFIVGDLKFYWVCAILGSGIFALQLIMFVFGGNGGDVNGDGTVEFGEHADFGFSDFRLFSLRSIVAFITFFGWGGIIFGNLGGISTFFAAFTAGLIMMISTASVLFFALRLQQSGNINPKDYIGTTGSVYLTIPGERKGTGKVSVSVQGSFRQIDAFAEEELPTGTSVKVVSCLDNQRYLVEKIK